MGSQALDRRGGRSDRAQCDRYAGVSIARPTPRIRSVRRTRTRPDRTREESGGCLTRASAEGCLGARRHPSETRVAFRWQWHGYGAFSLSERDPGAVVDYIRRQRERHGSGELTAEWE